MATGPMIQATVVRGLRSLGQPSGRDSRRQFWVYTGCVVAVLFVVFQVITAIWLGPELLQTQGSARGSAVERITIAAAAFAIVLVALLGAAVSRRLHDTDHSAAWGLLPLPFLLIGLYGVGRFATVVDDTDRFDGSTFALLFLNNVAYLGALGVLAWKLVGSATAGENRYGPPPATP